jgi:hypothetical protein
MHASRGCAARRASQDSPTNIDGANPIETFTNIDRNLCMLCVTDSRIFVTRSAPTNATRAAQSHQIDLDLVEGPAVVDRTARPVTGRGACRTTVQDRDPERPPLLAAGRVAARGPSDGGERNDGVADSGWCASPASRRCFRRSSRDETQTPPMPVRRERAEMGSIMGNRR